MLRPLTPFPLPPVALSDTYATDWNNGNSYTLLTIQYTLHSAQAQEFRPIFLHMNLVYFLKSNFVYFYIGYVIKTNFGPSLPNIAIVHWASPLWGLQWFYIIRNKKFILITKAALQLKDFIQFSWAESWVWNIGE